MTPRLRKLALTAHVTFSVGWLGTVVAFLALAIVGLTSGDAQVVKGAYIAMGAVGWFAIVPFSLAALITGIIQSLGTPWGLIRHYWVATKLVLTILAVGVLLLHMGPVSLLASAAADGALSSTDLRGLRIQIAVDAAAGLLVLLVNTTLSVYKPRGLTWYGRRIQAQQRATAVAEQPPSPLPARTATSRGAVGRSPRWAYIVGFHALVLGALFVVLHLAGGGFGGH